jgi:hypothetical protein
LARQRNRRRLSRCRRYRAERFAGLHHEALTHTDLPQVDSIELYNPNSSAASIANWFITDSRGQPFKFRIPAGDSRATIPAKGYVVFTENDWNANPNSPPASASIHMVKKFTLLRRCERQPYWLQRWFRF